MKGTEPLSPLPYFPQDHDWPEPLKSILSFAKTPAQHDVLLLGAMTVLGASLSHIVRCKYGDKWQYPCLQTFITGHAAAGKSVLVWVRKLIEPIHEEIRRQVAESMKAYRKELRAYEALGKARKDKEPPVAPPNRMFIIPGNNTGTGLLQNLIDSDGTGIICESEADTVSTAIGRNSATGRRHAAQGVRPRPPVLQPPHRPGIQGNHRLLPVRYSSRARPHR